MSKSLRDALKEAGLAEMERRSAPVRKQKKQPLYQPKTSTIVVKRSIKKLLEDNA